MATKRAPAKKAEQKPANKTAYTGPFPRIGSVVQWADDGTVGIVVWDDINNPGDKNLNTDDRQRWECYRLDDPSYREAVWFSTNDVKDGEVRIVGHFDIFGLTDLAAEKPPFWEHRNTLNL